MTKTEYFVGDPLSGVGQLPYAGCTAQPISRTAIITAAHCTQGNNGPGHVFAIYFADAPDVWIGVTSWVDHPGWSDGGRTRPLGDFAHDLSIGFLASPLPSYVPVYQLVTLGPGGNPTGATIHVGGYGLQGTGATGATSYTGTKREGLNRVSGTINGLNNFTFDFDASGYTVCDKECVLTSGTGRGAEYGIFEAVTAPGDSGSAILYDLCTDFEWRRPDIITKPTDCTLRILGICSFGPSRDPAGNYGDVSGAVNIAPHLDWIHSVLASQVTVTQITEPAQPIAGVEYQAVFADAPEVPQLAVQPPGASTWPIGSTQTITWASTGLVGNVKIELSRDGGTSWTLINGSTPNDGTYTWIATGPATTQARVRVTSLTNPSVSDISDNNFTIGGGTIAIAVANGGEVWPIGSSQSIVWTSSGLTGNVKIELSRDGGTSWALISGNTANDGAHPWMVTGAATTQARLRVTSLTNPAVFDVSNANFTIGGGTITVTYPNGGEVWPIGSVQNIRWASAGLAGNVKIEVSRNGGATWALINGNTPNDGTYMWPVAGPATREARIRVTNLANPAVSDASNANATIGGGAITVTAPNGGEVWPIGSSQTIRWISSGLTGKVKIEVSRTGGSSWAVLSSGTSDDGAYTWLVTGPATSQARFRVTSLTDPTVGDVSNASAVLGGGHITVTAPGAGAVWPIGSIQNVTWTSTGLTGNVRIDISRDGGVSWALVLGSTANDGVHGWSVTGPATSQARFRVTSLTDPTVGDATDTSIAIQ
ncbi:MAG TPA: hypothetical protein VGT40_08755 [Methylomirabilota bacterium]|nr:hypothetical protein [Methylomirabilota bacterium]